MTRSDDQLEWWLDESTLPDVIWALLRVLPDGAAEVLEADGRKPCFDSILAEEVQPVHWFRRPRSGRMFEGTVEGGAFDVQRVIRYRNSCLPKIRGIIQAEPQGSSISLTMSLSTPIMIVVPVCIALLVSEIARQDWARPDVGGIVVLAFVWPVVAVGFSTEAATAEGALLRIFKAARWRPDGQVQRPPVG